VNEEGPVRDLDHPDPGERSQPRPSARRASAWSWTTRAYPQLEVLDQAPVVRASNRDRRLLPARWLIPSIARLLRRVR
jgi:hypothetical protein